MGSYILSSKNQIVEPRHGVCMYFYEKLCTYRKHFEDLQPIGSPAFLGFVDWQREVNVSGILREKQHQEDSPADRNNLP